MQTHSEAITALGGHEREEEILSGKLKKLTAATKDVHVGNSKFDLIFKLFYTYVTKSPPPLQLVFLVESRTLAGCASSPIEPHQYLLGSVATYLTYADVRAFR